MSQDELAALMQEAGELEEVYVLRDRTTGESKGAAFVTYVRQCDADQAIKWCVFFCIS